MHVTFGGTTDQRNYTIEYTTNLVNAAWMVLQAGVPGSNGVTTVDDTTPTNDTRYYRAFVIEP